MNSDLQLAFAWAKGDPVEVAEILMCTEYRHDLLDAMGISVLPIQCPDCDHKPAKKPKFTCAACGSVKVHDEFEILLARNTDAS